MFGDWMYDAPNDASSGRRSSTAISRMFGRVSTAASGTVAQERAAAANKAGSFLTRSLLVQGEAKSSSNGLGLVEPASRLHSGIAGHLL